MLRLEVASRYRKTCYLFDYGRQVGAMRQEDEVCACMFVWVGRQRTTGGEVGEQSKSAGGTRWGGGVRVTELVRGGG